MLVENILDEFLTHLEVCSSGFQEDIFFKIIQKIDPIVLKRLAGDGWFTATEIATKINISKQKLGRIANQLKIKDNPQLCKSFIIRVSDKKYSRIYLYSKKSIILFSQANRK